LLSNSRVAKFKPLKESAVIKDKTSNDIPERRCRPRQQLRGFGSGGYRPVAFESNKWNELQSLKTRVLVETPTIDEEFVKEAISWLKRNHEEIFPRIHKVRSVDFDLYLANSNASPSVKAVLSKTFLKLKQDNINYNSKLSGSQKKLWTIRKSFVKVEHLLYRSRSGRKHKAPRMIQGAQPEFVCLMGPWFAALQSRIKKRWGANNFLCYVSGVKSKVAANKLFDITGPFLEDDIGTFDSSVHRLWLEYECWLSKRFGAPRAVLDLQRANIDTRGKTSHGWRYRVKGGRKSGDPYTSLYNSVLNACMHLYLYHTYTNKSITSIKSSLRMLVVGDDNALRHVENAKYPWVRDMARFGFNSEALYRDRPSQVEFCSNRLVPVKDGWVFCPKPGKVMAKLGYFIDPPKNVSNESLLRGTALGLLKACSASPPLVAYLNRILQLTIGHEAYTPPLEEWKMDYDVSVPTSETWAVLYDTYNWDVQRQVLFEQSLAGMVFGDEFQTPLVSTFYDIDTSAPRHYFPEGVLSF
jgi:hypothetical protein